MLLVMDVARFKYMPHWVPLPSMKKAIDTVDGSTSEPHGACDWLLQMWLPFGLYCR